MKPAVKESKRQDKQKTKTIIYYKNSMSKT